LLVDDHAVVIADFRMLLASQYFIRDESIYVERALDAGAKGYVSKK
jgi:DNA-binding NarL/FixJ family response regulator